VRDQLPAGDEQDEVIRFLSHPASYGTGVGHVERIETHCSIVFLVADRAYKLKRAIRYASLDYTTRALRHAACQAELLLNRRTAPELYLAVRAITREAAGGLTFDGDGPTLDHVVVMRRFAQTDLFDHMLKSGRLTPELMRALGRIIAAFHQAAEPMPGFGGSEAIRRVISDNERELAKVAADLDGAAVGTLGRRARAALDSVGALLDRRRGEGKVRRCHGDLRLANICLYAGQPTPFDCIEFSDEIGCIDVLYDLAFLLMDTRLHGHGELSNAVFNAYLDAAPETDGLRALPLFLALRAATRSYALAGSARRQGDAAQAVRTRAFAHRHIEAGLNFLRPHQPLLILLGGEPGSGRTGLAASLAAMAEPAPGARWLRFAPGEEVWPEATALLEAGCTVLIEGNFTDGPERAAALELASRLGVRVLAFWFGQHLAGPDPRHWRVLDAGSGVSDAVACAAPQVKAMFVRSEERLRNPS
jgi:aminoglycoside phosphotransferase family enzyme/predicted kinase